jgi:hypothetical protein
MHLDLERVRENVRKATTEDLLDRATIYRDGMTREALEIIERELRDRGVTPHEIAEHERIQRARSLVDSEGLARRCQKCQRPAVGESWGWHHLWGLVPLFPRRLAWCGEHRPKRHRRYREEH